MFLLKIDPKILKHYNLIYSLTIDILNKDTFIDFFYYLYLPNKKSQKFNTFLQYLC